MHEDVAVAARLDAEERGALEGVRLRRVSVPARQQQVLVLSRGPIDACVYTVKWTSYIRLTQFTRAICNSR